MKSESAAPGGSAPEDETVYPHPARKQDIDDIWDYIANDRIEATDRVLKAVERAIMKLARNPNLGHWREELADKRHRFFLVYSYPIVYRHETKPLVIIRVLHAGRDVQSILGLSADVS